MTKASGVIERIINRLKRIVRRTRGERVVVVHNHLFKNAGSTLDWALHRNFGDAFVDHRDDDAMRKGAAYLGDYLVRHAELKAVSSHHIVMPLPQIPNVRLRHIMMFRHPLERVASVYNFERKQTIDIPGTIKARSLPLREYVLWRMQPDAPPAIRDFHLRKLLPREGRGRGVLTEDDLKQAIAALGAVDLLGLVESFDASMVLFETELNSDFSPGLDLAYVPQNVGRSKDIGLEQRLDALRAEIGTEVYELLMANNRLDLALYAAVQEEFGRRVERIAGFDGRLQRFRQRCERLRENAA